MTSIGNEAVFSWCYNLTTIDVASPNPQYDSRNNCNAIIEKSTNKLIAGCKNTVIPSNVEIIGNAAFSGCTTLNSVTIPNGVVILEEYSFDNTGLVNLNLPNSLVTIKNNAFKGCTELKTVHLGNNLKELGYEVFQDCSALTSINIPEGIEEIGYSAFSRCIELKAIEIPSSVSSIKGWTFENCTSLTSVKLNEGLVNIGRYAFQGCSKLEEIEFPSTLKSIVYEEENESAAFKNCTSLERVIFKEGLEKIGPYTFQGCSNINSIVLPNSINSIGSRAFEGCNGLTSITMPNNIVSFTGNLVFGDKNNIQEVYISNLEKWCATSFTNGNNPLRSGAKLFLNGVEVTDLEIPNGIKIIETAVFEGCASVVTAKIPKTVTNIKTYAFASCVALNSINIPNSVSSIEHAAFKGCGNLINIKVDWGTPLSITDDTFTNRINAKLYVPHGSKATYNATDYWKDFKDIIEFIEGDVNSDDEVDVLDVVDIACYVVGNPSNKFADFLADINNDGTVNIGDAVTLVNVIAGDQNFARAMKAQRKVMANDILTLTENDGELSLNLANERKYTAFQFDLYTPEGTDVEKVMLNALRKQKHQLLYNKVEDSHYRVAALSTSNKVFKDNDGELLNIAVSDIGSNEVCIRDIHFFDVEGNDYKFADIMESEATGIEKLTTALFKGDGDIYDLQGRKMKDGSLTKGMYIVGGKKMMVKE